jgi:pantothenate kinase
LKVSFPDEHPHHKGAGGDGLFEKMPPTMCDVDNATTSLIPALITDIMDIKVPAHEQIIVGLAGPPGSGKSTLAKDLVDEINARGECTAKVLPMDGFHLSNSQLEQKGIASIKGAPETFDVDGFIATLSRIRSPERSTVFVADYSRVLDEPIAASIAITADTNVVVLEGNYLLLDSGSWKDVWSYLEHAWFLSVDWDVCRERLIRRQMASGKSIPAATEWVDRSDKANYDLVVSSSRTQGVRLIPQPD